MKILNRLACALQDHIRVTEMKSVYVGKSGGSYEVTRCTRCGWTSRRLDG